jgi:hypothetical protein
VRYLVGGAYESISDNTFSVSYRDPSGAGASLLIRLMRVARRPGSLGRCWRSSRARDWWRIAGPQIGEVLAAIVS